MIVSMLIFAGGVFVGLLVERAYPNAVTIATAELMKAKAEALAAETALKKMLNPGL